MIFNSTTSFFLNRGQRSQKSSNLAGIKFNYSTLHLHFFYLNSLLVMDSEEMLNVSVLEWMADTGYLLRLQQQCENYKQAGKVRTGASSTLRL